MNKWGIPAEIEAAVLNRDLACVYCHTNFDKSTQSKGKRGSWEHIINDASIITLENIVRCCGSCNSSKGTKSLRHWFESKFCRDRGISELTVADIVKAHILRYGLI